jgi:hypothetical protein
MHTEYYLTRRTPFGPFQGQTHVSVVISSFAQGTAAWLTASTQRFPSSPISSLRTNRVTAMHSTINRDVH